jgi:hypothetical protein
MTDTTTTTATSETFFQHVKDFFVGDETDAVDVIDGLASKFDADVWPSVKTFIETLASQVGQAALKASIVALPTLAAGGFGAAAATVGAAVVATATIDAPIDAQQALQATQAAIQVVKVANSTVTAGDAPTVVAIAAAAAPVVTAPAA